MKQGELFVLTQTLFDQLCCTEILRAGFRHVKRNGGSPGIDGISIKTFELVQNEELARLKAELEGWSYKPKPVRRVEIPKPNGGVRLLGVPCVRDRVVQASLKILLEPVFDPEFSEFSYGFRPGKNQKQAILAAADYVKEGKEYVVDIDLSKFFDGINHDRMLMRVQQKVEDKRIIKLIGLILRSGVLKDGIMIPTTEGATQGSPLSPLLSNIVLDELDKELERRNLSFCRYADDCNIFVKSQKAADRVMRSVCNLLEKKMKLKVNREKSKTGLSSTIKFLGMTIILGTIAISTQSMNRAMEKVKELTPRVTSLPIEKSIQEFNKWYRGWSSYYEMTQYPSQFQKLESHARRRWRAQLIRNLKRPRTIAKTIVKAGMKPKVAKRVARSHMGWWALSHDPAMERLYPVDWFVRKGMLCKSPQTYDHWYSVKRRVRFL